MNVLDLFSGIGGFSLGLERAGMRTVAFCECDPYCQRVLRKHWPDVPIFDDVRSLTVHDGWLVANADERCEPAQEQLQARRQTIRSIDLICGGFPCQDISVAGKGAGIGGERSGLWSEFGRIIGEIRPRYIIVENVAALLGRGIERVLGDLAALGFDAEWHCIPACAVGAPHRRDRVWIIAHTASSELEGRDDPEAARAAFPEPARMGEYAAYYAEISLGIRRGDATGQWWAESDVGRVATRLSPEMDGDLNAAVLGAKEGGPEGSLFGECLLRELWRFRSLTAASLGLQQTNGRDHSLSALSCEGRSGGRFSPNEADEKMRALRQELLADPQQEAQSLQPRMPFNRWPHECNETVGIWEVEPDVGRVATGVKNRVDRLRALGNAIVPQIAEIIGRAIMEIEHGSQSAHKNTIDLARRQESQDASLADGTAIEPQIISE